MAPHMEPHPPAAPTRRSFLKAGMLALSGVGLADVMRLRAQAQESGRSDDTSVILLWLPGGPLGSDWARRSGTPASLLGHASPARSSEKPSGNSWIPPQEATGDDLRSFRMVALVVSP